MNHSYQYEGVKVLKSSHPTIRKLKCSYDTEIHGNKLWGSSFLIMKHLKKNPLHKKDHVLDLGCGWGMTGIYAQKKFGCKVTSVDADENVFPYLEAHEELNKVQLNQKVARFEKLTSNFLKDIDVIVAADVCFWDELTDIHYNLIKRAKKVGVKKIIYGDPVRETFTNLIEKCEKDFNVDSPYMEAKTTRKITGQLMIL